MWRNLQGHVVGNQWLTNKDLTILMPTRIAQSEIFKLWMLIEELEKSTCSVGEDFMTFRFALWSKA